MLVSLGKPHELTYPQGIITKLVNARPFSPHLERVYMKTRELPAMGVT